MTLSWRNSTRGRRFLFVAFGWCVLGCAAAHAQVTAPSSSHLPDAPFGRDRDEDDWGNRKEVQDRLQRTREKERQRRIVDDAKRLVELTVMYRKALEEHGTPTADDQKLLVQIEKLAREVKDRMRGM